MGVSYLHGGALLSLQVVADLCVALLQGCDLALQLFACTATLPLTPYQCSRQEDQVISAHANHQKAQP